MYEKDKKESGSCHQTFKGAPPVSLTPAANGKNLILFAHLCLLK
jgi:hypothetical protein